MLSNQNYNVGLIALFSAIILCSCTSLNPTFSDQIFSPSDLDVNTALLEPASKNLHDPETPPPESIAAINAEDKTIPEPDATIDQEIAALEALGDWDIKSGEQLPQEGEITYDFPVTINRQVAFYLDFFSNKQNKSFARWLARSGRYLPFIKAELIKAGLPQDLAYLPMIESGFSLTAYSKARAVGPWQFIQATGRRYGLSIDKYVDERRDPEKSTQAAIDYLSDLYDRFQSWPLAVAAYNAGEGKIQRAITKYETNDFWKLAEKHYLKLETERYVPKLIAAIIIAKNPGKYGFTDIIYEPPLAFETLSVPRWTSLRALAVASGTPFEEIRNLNRQLRHAMTPPDSADYTVKVPVGKGKLAAANMPKVKATVVTDYKTHEVRKGETLSGICKKYTIQKTILLKANNLRSASLIPGNRLRIPYQTTVYTLVDKKIGQAWAGPASPTMENMVIHKIKPGETLSAIARYYHVPMHLIAAWNDISDLAKIREGDQLALYLKDNDSASAKTTAEKTLASNQAEPPKDPERPLALSALNKKIRPESDPAAAMKATYYEVRGGDSLWKIAKKFRITPDEIRQWNKLDSDLIFPGHRLLLKLAADTGA